MHRCKKGSNKITDLVKKKKDWDNRKRTKRKIKSLFVKIISYIDASGCAPKSNQFNFFCRFYNHVGHNNVLLNKKGYMHNKQ